MDSFGNRIEIQQGEDWNLDILVSASNREYIPFIVSSERQNPYFVLTVASTKYEKNMRYVASWWNEPEGKIVGDSLPTFYQTTPVDIGVLSTAPTSSFQPDDIPEEYQTDESAEKRYLYQYMLESEDVDEKVGHRPYHYLYFEYPEVTGRLSPNFAGKLASYLSSIIKIRFGVEDKQLHDHIVNSNASNFSAVVDVGIAPEDNLKAYLEEDGTLYVLTDNFDDPIIFPENCSSLFKRFGAVGAFYNCTEIYITRTYTRNVVRMNNMFSNLSRLKSVDLSGMSIESCFTMEDMFSNCTKLTSVYMSDYLINQIHNKQTLDNLTTRRFFYNCPRYPNPDGYLTGRNGYWTEAYNTNSYSNNVSYTIISDCTLATNAVVMAIANVPICHVDDYACYIRFNLDSDITEEWNGQNYKYAITLVDGPTLVDTLQTIAMANNGGVLPDDYPTSLKAQYKYVKIKYPNQLSTDIDVTSPIGKIEHPEPILTPTDLIVYNNLRKLI